MQYTAFDLEETQKIVSDFVMTLKPKKDSATVVGLYGDLCAGKTTCVQAIAKALQVGEKVASPTFVIMKVYELPNNKTAQKFTHLVHIDTYRMEDPSELTLLGWSEIIANPNNLVLIEWPERVSVIMPEHIKISLKPLENETSRAIEIVV